MNAKTTWAGVAMVLLSSAVVAGVAGSALMREHYQFANCTGNIRSVDYYPEGGCSPNGAGSTYVDCNATHYTLSLVFPLDHDDPCPLVHIFRKK